MQVSFSVPMDRVKPGAVRKRSWAVRLGLGWLDLKEES